MVPNREITSLISTKTSYEAMMKTVTKDTLRNYKKTNDDLPFLLEKRNIGKCQKLVCNLHDKKNMSYTQNPWRRH